MLTRHGALSAAILMLLAVEAGAQAPATRLAIVLAENRRAPTAADVALLVRGARSSDPQTARIALRALGRLERPSLIPDIVPGLSYRFPETRAEAANAVGQAAQGFDASRPGVGLDPGSVLTTLLDRLALEEEPSVRAAICQSIGRLPYTRAEDIDRAEQALVSLAATSTVTADRLGVVKALELRVRLHGQTLAPGPRAIIMLRALAGIASAQHVLPIPPAQPRPLDLDPLRDARVRRLALEALIIAHGAHGANGARGAGGPDGSGGIDAELVERAGSDPDAQVRRLAMRAARLQQDGFRLRLGLSDEAAMVRFEALNQLTPVDGEYACLSAVAAARDEDARVALLALDRLTSCGAFPDAVRALERTITDLSQAGAPRGWHRSAHALVSLAGAAPDQARTALGQFVQSTNWHLRVYAARAAAVLGDDETLRRLARDAHDNVAEAGISGLTEAAVAAGELFVEALGRSAYPVVRAAARALDGSPHEGVVPALRAALQRLNGEGRPNSLDTRRAIAATLTRLGAPPPALKPPAPHVPRSLTAENLRRLAAPRARITIRDVGAFELALVTTEAPATVLHFAELAESGYYNGLSFHRLVPNFVIQGGSPGADEFAGDADYMRDEVGLWPHVRGGVGISTRGRDTGDAQIFIDLADNPRLDYAYTVFAQVLTGIEVVDRILEGDIIERIEIIP
jgi:cyclophilin family peptidyl-prolyl cis-trans isomerase